MHDNQEQALMGSRKSRAELHATRDRRDNLKAEKIGNAFVQNTKTKEGRDKIYRSIVKKVGFEQFFVGGFSLGKLDRQLDHFADEDKALMIGHMLEALEMDLGRLNSSQGQTRRDEIALARERLRLHVSPGTALHSLQSIGSKSVGTLQSMRQ